MDPIEAMARTLGRYHGQGPDVLDKIWRDWEHEARAAWGLAFNRIAATGKVNVFDLADAAVEILGNSLIPPSDQSAASPRS
ncbi:MAG: hypothetical protein K0R61_137 [Microvirga sp.]|nr:hypothetical protein [Microvirga sp.]